MKVVEVELILMAKITKLGKELDEQKSEEVKNGYKNQTAATANPSIFPLQ